MDVDLVVLGAGLAGSLLLHRLCVSGWLAGHRVAVVDARPRPLMDRHWCYWSRASVVPGADRDVWPILRVRDSVGEAVVLRPASQRYRRLSGALLDEVLAPVWGYPGVLDLRGVAARVTSGGTVLLDSGQRLRARSVVDSARRPLVAPGSPALAFVGLRIPTSVPGVTLMDFMVPQRAGLSFGYVLPLGPQCSLAELTAYVPAASGAVDLAPAARAWVARDFGAAAGHAAVVAEAGWYPLRPLPAARPPRPASRVPLSEPCDPLPASGHPRRSLSSSKGAEPAGQVVPAGAAAGVLRAATGYGVLPMARHAAAMAAALQRGGRLPSYQPGLAPWVDRVFLRLVARDPELVRAALPRLFAEADPDLVLDFLDRPNPRQLVSLARVLPAGAFARAALAEAAHSM